jgi:hypothetical protein
MSVSSTIVANNTAAAGVANDLAEKPPALGSFTVGFDLIEDPGIATLTQAPIGSNQFGVDPQLGPLGASGGPTQTRLIAPTSPAVDAGEANGLTTDQRGLVRTAQQPGANVPGSDGTDIGAVELPDTVLENPTASTKGKQKEKGKKIVVRVSAGAAEAVFVHATGSIKAGAKLPLAAANADVGPKETRKLTLKPSKKSSARKIAELLAHGKKPTASISVTLTDRAGNSVTKKLTTKLTTAKRRRG